VSVFFTPLDTTLFQQALSPTITTSYMVGIIIAYQNFNLKYNWKEKLWIKKQ
jgi:hypothetical protein